VLALVLAWDSMPPGVMQIFEGAVTVSLQNENQTNQTNQFYFSADVGKTKVSFEKTLKQLWPLWDNISFLVPCARLSPD